MRLPSFGLPSLKLPNFRWPRITKYAPIPHPEREPSVRTILNHISNFGWVISVAGLTVAALLIAAAARRIVSWAFTLFLCVVFATFWYLLIYREAGYEVNGELIDMGYNDFPNDSPYR